MEPKIAASATVEPGAALGSGAVVWDLTQIRSGASIGRECVIGRNVFVDAGVVVGDRCKIQNNALLYAPAWLGDGVFVGPAVVLTNDRFPRAVAPDGSLQETTDWHAEGVRIESGASVGAGAVVLAGVTVGSWALIAAGAMVIHDVPPHALVGGNPAKQLGWVGRAGRPLVAADDGTWRCPITGATFVTTGPGGLQEQ